MTRDQVHALIQKDELGDVSGYAIISEATEDYGDLWAVYTQNKRYLRTGDEMDMSIGNGAILVEKRSGKIFHTGSAMDTGYYVEAYRACGDPLAERSQSIEIREVSTDVDKTQLIQIIRDIRRKNPTEAEKMAEDIIDKRCKSIIGPYPGDEVRLYHALESIGVKCEYVWESYDDEAIFDELNGDEGGSQLDFDIKDDEE